MKSNISVKIQANKQDKTEYLIKDKDDIIIGRFTTIEINNNSKAYDINLRFYRESNYELLSETLNLILKAAFRDFNIFKVNIKTLETIDVNPFLDSGFTLEGILNQNEYLKGEYLDELSFGITRTEYNQMSRYSLVELNGRNIILRNLTSSDAEDVLEYYKKNKTYLEPFEPVKDNNFYTLETQKKFLNKSYREFLNGTTVELGIFKKERLIGKIKLSRIIHGSFKNGTLGYSIDEGEQGKGYMTESVNLMLKYAFDECELHRIEASALVDNKKSRTVLEKSGFKLVGINERYLLINGKWEDHATYYIIREEFKDR
ncbi:GNAT family N-acetyltransferase [Clostridium chromiireducens]|uniref:N-acetyltransferase n=1 Tax=Clostridium chromiireducens TaxID=225345 RepID=A0A1V4I3I2_9CLOT|nr:GNAT family protein [Clostridium chromiireducens]MVX67428.1 GNAT family N-acetyltransferase [Clostridium chromiireducens]OPJ54543.1 putative ribosomal N-acetyltransferase YdaF [Clostridium chromiireducens]RII32062.1 N-acetyltransferase [Clostridium chromiireducens]